MAFCSVYIWHMAHENSEHRELIMFISKKEGSPVGKYVVLCDRALLFNVSACVRRLLYVLLEEEGSSVFKAGRKMGRKPWRTRYVLKKEAELFINGRKTMNMYVCMLWHM